MKATEANLLEFLRKSPQFVIPIYQRTYSWNWNQCWQLWQDILRTGKNDKSTAYFIGSIVYVEKGLFQVTGNKPLLVIDGQQRLTTVTLLIEALARCVGKNEPIEGFNAEKLRQYYLLNHLEKGDRKFKLLLSQTDKASLLSLIDPQQPKPSEDSIRVEENFRFFTEWIAGEKDNIAAVCTGLAKLMIVDISLNRSQDNPQLIFESLNSTGLELSKADLIRNFILMGLEPELQTRLYGKYWRPMEVAFGQQAYSSYFDSFMRHYLTVKTGVIPNIGQVYVAYKNYAQLKNADMESLVADLQTFAGYYCSIALGAETDNELKDAFQDLLELRVDVALPFLLELYHDYVNQILTKTEFLKAVRLVESYVFRRYVCFIPTNSHNKTFANFPRALKKDRYLESIQAHFLLLPSYRRFPDDEEFKRELQVKNLYRQLRNCTYLLSKLENVGRKEPVPVDEYTIEHIMPQNENLSDVWQTDLGSEWERIHQTYLHTLGNLTLTGYNSEYSDRPFTKKRDIKGGFRESPLRLNDGLSVLERWNEASIRGRAEKLANQAIGIWTSPALDPAILDAYRQPETSAKYKVDDYPYLAATAVREVFEAFRKQVLALDPCVAEEFLKFYIAYKAETNFVDIVPQAKRLLLSLNMPFPEIRDPKGICKDVTGVGKWGNGDVQVGLSSLEELPYVMGLVRQAFEKQMGNGGDV